MTATELRILPTCTTARAMRLALALSTFVANQVWRADASPTPAAAAPAPVRLAVLAEDALAETRSLADLLTVELARQPGVETVERSEIQRVLAEQTLTAGGLADAATRVRLGRILRAAGLVFVQREAGGNRILIRLAETRRGFVAGFCMASAGDVAQPAAIAAELRGMLPKLAFDLSRQTTVSLLRFSTALLPSSVPPHPSEGRFEALMVMRLMERLCKEPDIVVTERRRLGDLVREEQLSGGAGDLAAGALLVDGEVATAARLRTPGGDEAVTLTMRIRDLASGSPAPVVLTGARKDLDRLMAAAVDGAGDALLKHRRAKRESEPPQGETESLLILARQKGLVWAGEAAYALNPTDKAVRDAYLKALLDEGDVEQPRDVAPRDAYLKVALALARAEQVAREQGVTLWGFTKAGIALEHLRHNLEHEMTRSDREIAQWLRPFRAAMRRECEAEARRRKDPAHKGAGYAVLVEWSAALYETREERQAFIESLLDSAATDSAWEEPMRDYLVSYLLTQHDWPAKVFAEHGAHADPVRRFYGHYGLMRKTFDPRRQRAHARESLHALDALLQRPDALGSYFVIPRVSMNSNRWLSSALQEICARYPDFEPEVNQKMFARMRALHAAGNCRSLVLLEPTVHLRGLPRNEVVPWLDEVAAARAGAPPPEYLIGEMFKALAELRRKKMSEPTPSVRSGSVRFRRQILLPAGDSTDGWYADGSGAHGPSLSKKFVPQRLLVEGDTLWIGLAGDYERERASRFFAYACGLAQFDLPTGRIRSARSGWLKTTQSDGTSIAGITKDGKFFYCPLHPLRRWRNWVVVAHGNGGIALFPVDPPPGAAALSGVTLLTSSTGLPVMEVHGWTTLGDTLYVRSQDRFIVAWDANTCKATLLFDNMRQITGVSMPEHDKFSVDDLWSDEAAQRLVLTGTLWLRSGVQSSYRRAREGSAWLFYHPATTRWTYSQEAPARAAVAPGPNVKAREALLADGIDDILDVAIWQDKILAVIGYGESWRLELLTEE